ncbi:MULTISPECIES: lysine N(6)-hydroxylase/L-ornithine N(5)-oxygenase family protein [Burkholderia]|uniref:Lysine/ornithine N-monooxygenase n=1 Tax=Burkholderia paludis TaxID=1506587 RepID=A0A6J5DP55_9BURK|nr:MULTISPECIES: SidA/IucD/PvdA family monooxygenase [Burkholderia]CAB3754982.1 L-ornithine N(5)-monooxygenase [Burkholderia paludis]VWB33884.1 lysine/ornithine N-monooxygenase [Burkholderia paludis]
MPIDQYAPTPAVDLLGIGFGPSNLALAIALDEAGRASGQALQARFIERKPSFAWHSGMLLQDSRMQISFLKDLVTLRDPCSPFSFLKYLHEQGRLEDFVNLRSFLPTRIEYDGYLRWAAEAFADRTHYGESVLSVRPRSAGGKVRALEVVSRRADGSEVARTASNLVLAVGGRPSLPAPLAALDGPSARRLVHSSAYLPSIDGALRESRAEARAAGRRVRIAVLGGGQSGAEIFQDLVQRGGLDDDLDVTLAIRGSALKPADDSPFVNEIFHADFTDEIYHRSPDARQRFFDEYRGTNYSVVDIDLLERLYELFYMQKVSAQPRHTLLTQRHLIAATPGAHGLALTFDDTARGVSETREYDIVVAATGYRRDDYRNLLDGVAPYLGEFEVGRDYRLKARDDFQPGIWLQGGCEATHGLSDTLLSILAVRSAEIGASVYDACVRRTERTPAVA